MGIMQKLFPKPTKEEMKRRIILREQTRQKKFEFERRKRAAKFEEQTKKQEAALAEKQRRAAFQKQLTQAKIKEYNENYLKEVQKQQKRRAIEEAKKRYGPKPKSQIDFMQASANMDAVLTGKSLSPTHSPKKFKTITRLKPVKVKGKTFYKKVKVIKAVKQKSQKPPAQKPWTLD